MRAQRPCLISSRTMEDPIAITVICVRKEVTNYFFLRIARDNSGISSNIVSDKLNKSPVSVSDK